jgi:hypothetical protein
MIGEFRIRVPFIHDHHSHVSLYAAFEGLPDLSALGKADALDLLGTLPRDRLTLIKGWRTDRLSFQNGDLADMPPAMLVNASLHGFEATPAALPFINRLWPELADKIRDPAWGERNLPDLFAFYVKIAGLDALKIDAFMTRMATLGIGSLEDMTIAGEDSLAAIRESRFAERIVAWAALTAYRALRPESRAKCAGVKLFLDGSLGAGSAALDAPFSDGRSGALLYADDELSALLSEIASYGARLSVHAIGHRAIEQALNCAERLSRDGAALPSPRIEHAQFIGLEQARRCKQLGAILSMQPNFNSDSSDYADRLMPRHREGNNPFRMLIDEAGFVPGVDLVFGSDGMPHGPECALEQSLFPVYEGQRLSPDELVAGYSPARGASGEDSTFAVYTRERRVRRIVPT